MRKIICVGGMMVLILACTLWSLSSALGEQNGFWSQSFYEFLKEYHAKEEMLTEEAFNQWKNSCEGKKVRWTGWIDEICYDYIRNEYTVKIQTHWGISMLTSHPERVLSGWRIIAHIPEWKAPKVQKLRIDQKVEIIAVVEDIYNYEVTVEEVRFVNPQRIEEMTEKSVKSLEFTTIERGFFSGFTEKKNWVIKTQEQWTELWNVHTLTRIPHPAPPAVNFEKEMVLAVFIGQRPTGGFAAEITKIKKYGNELIVFFTEVKPAPDALVTQVLTQPYHIIKIEKNSLPVKFKKVEENKK